MKTAIIGGGKVCKTLLELSQGSFLNVFKMDVVAVIDINPYASGVLYAKQLGIDIFQDIYEVFNLSDLSLIVELTGKEETLQIIHQHIQPGTRLIDHNLAQVFWDLVYARENQHQQLNELRALDSKLKHERHFLQGIFDAIPDLALVFDKNMNIIKANEKFANYIGIHQEELIGKNFFTIANNNDICNSSGDTPKLLQEVLATEKTITFIQQFKLPDENHWEITFTPLINENNEIENILGTWHKITERVTLHRDKLSAEQQFRSFIHSADDWISIKDTNSRYIIVNNVTADAMGLQPEDFIGKTPNEILPKDLAKTINKHDKQVLESRSHKTFNEIIPIRGQDHHFSTVRFPLTDYKGEITGICTISRDVTKEIRLQEQLMQSEKLAAIGHLAAGVAHEINNPLTGILAYAEDLMDEFPDHKFVQENIDVIIRETLRCRDIVRNLLDFARQDKPNLQLVDLNFIIEHTMYLVNKLPQFKDIKINKVLSQNIPKIYIDLHQMQQVLLNFLLNAADAMHYIGEIIISSDYDESKNECILSVEDNGPGIPENLIDKIFEPFFSTKGTNGLGLAVSWGIVERHGGKIEIDTPENFGAVFKIVLPVNDD